MPQYYVYMLTNGSGTLYTGVTNDLQRRVFEHKNKSVEGFTHKYNVTRLVYYEVTEDVRSAIGREKQIKGWVRAKKIALIDSLNRPCAGARHCERNIHLSFREFRGPPSDGGLGVSPSTFQGGWAGKPGMFFHPNPNWNDLSAQWLEEKDSSVASGDLRMTLRVGPWDYA